MAENLFEPTSHGGIKALAVAASILVSLASIDAPVACGQQVVARELLPPQSDCRFENDAHARRVCSERFFGVSAPICAFDAQNNQPLVALVPNFTGYQFGRAPTFATPNQACLANPIMHVPAENCLTPIFVAEQNSVGIRPADPRDVFALPSDACLPACCSPCTECFSGSGPIGECHASLWQPPHAFQFTFHEDAHNLIPMVKEDSRAIFNWHNGLILAVAAGGAIAIHQDIDRDVRRRTLRHPNRWGGASKTIGKLGDVTVQLPLLFGLYGYTLRTQDPELHDFTRTLFSAYTISGLSTVVLKAVVNSNRPSDRFNGGQFGFPSFHAASSFAIAGVIDEYYGAQAGIPAYAFAGIIGWTRIDERDHDLSDVLFGAALGYVIGKSVASKHLCNDPRARLFPFVDPAGGSTGVFYERWY